MIVGATPTPDATILQTARRLYSRHHLRRVYYSAYSPIPFADTRLPAKPPPLIREHRLYQADWLMRFYRFTADELTTDTDQNLDLQIDPKLAWALRHRDWFPIDINKASKTLLLRIPGLGIRNVNRILAVRRFHRIRLEDLAKLRIPLKRAAPFILCEGHNPDALKIDSPHLQARVSQPQQLELFDSNVSATTGEF
jgi:predicted DNA-binding helix-hairpin-helix protein